MSERVSTSRRIVAQIDESSDDVARSRVLRNLQMLDDEEVALFDQLMFICTVLFDVPMAAITLIDEDRQWFAA